MSERTFLREDFSSLKELIDTLNERPNNDSMRGRDDSRSTGRGFAGTESYDEAISLLRFGYRDPIPKVKEALHKSKMVTSKLYQSIPKPLPKNHIVGFIPNVPNALRGVPQSMITVEKQPQKRRVLSIMYSNCTCGGTDADEMIEAGTALLSAINIIELSGIRTRLKVAFMTADDRHGEFIFPTVRVKDFDEQFNLQKLCFPLVHPSMLRRIGFKYLETAPKLKGSYPGYGHVTSFSDLKELVTDPDAVVISLDHIRHDLDNDVEQILEEIGVFSNNGK